jgi:hypothetical protein
VKSCRSRSFEAGKIFAVCHILKSKKVCTYWRRCVGHRSLPYTSLARALTFLVTLDQVTFPDRATVLVNLKPSMVISGQYGMSNMFIDVSHEPDAMALDFRMFKQAPFHRSVGGP